MPSSDPAESVAVLASRRRLIFDSLALSASDVGFGLVYGFAAHQASLSTIEVAAMSTIVYAGGAQFAALAYIAAGAPWLAIVLLTGFINARHLLYGAALAPYLADRSAALKAVMAHFLTDEAFALSISHFRRIGRADVLGYWLVAVGITFLLWVGSSVLGVALAADIPEPSRFGLDVVFPAAMAALAVGLITGRREVAAAIAGAAIGICVALAWDPAAGIVAGGVVGPLIGLLIPASRAAAPPLTESVA